MDHHSSAELGRKYSINFHSLWPDILFGNHIYISVYKALIFVRVPLSHYLMLIVIVLQEMMQLMAKLACNNIGHIDWEPHIPLMFTKIVRSLNLPVYYKQINSLIKPSKLDTASIAVWIVSVLVSVYLFLV